MNGGVVCFDDLFDDFDQDFFKHKIFSSVLFYSDRVDSWDLFASLMIVSITAARD